MSFNIKIDTKQLAQKIQNEIKMATDEATPQVANDLVDDVKDGKSEWNVLTGLSRDSFYVDDNVIKNRTDYAGAVEGGASLERLVDWMRGNIKKHFINRLKGALSG